MEERPCRSRGQPENLVLTRPCDNRDDPENPGSKNDLAYPGDEQKSGWKNGLVDPGDNQKIWFINDLVRSRESGQTRKSQTKEPCSIPGTTRKIRFINDLVILIPWTTDRPRNSGYKNDLCTYPGTTTTDWLFRVVRWSHGTTQKRFFSPEQAFSFTKELSENLPISKMVPVVVQVVSVNRHIKNINGPSVCARTDQTDALFRDWYVYIYICSRASTKAAKPLLQVHRDSFPLVIGGKNQSVLLVDQSFWLNWASGCTGLLPLSPSDSRKLLETRDGNYVQIPKVEKRTQRIAKTTSFQAASTWHFPECSSCPH